MFFLLKKTYIVVSYILQCLNVVQLVSLVIFVLCIFFYIVNPSNLVFKSYFKIFIKKIIILICVSFFFNTFPCFIFSLDTSTKEALLFVSVATISFTGGMTFWLLKNYDTVFKDCESTINEKIVQTKYDFILDYSKNFSGLPEKYAGDVTVMAPHIIWNRAVSNIFKNIATDRVHMSHKEWLFFGVGLNKFSEQSTSYFSLLNDLLFFRSKNPEIFKAGYCYYRYPSERPPVPNPDFYREDTAAFCVADRLDILDSLLKKLGGPSNFYVTKQFFNSHGFSQSLFRDEFFSQFSGISFDKYKDIQEKSKFTLSLFPNELNPENITVESFGWIYPLFWVLDKTLGLPNPIPKELFFAKLSGTTNNFFLNSLPSEFNIKPEDIFDPYFYSDFSKINVTKIDENSHPVTQSTELFNIIFKQIQNREKE